MKISGVTTTGEVVYNLLIYRLTDELGKGRSLALTLIGTDGDE
jgi:hypothetical protein